MRKIYKYPIPFHKNQVVKLPKNWMALDWQVQEGIPCLWAIIDTEEDAMGYEFCWLATGDVVPYNFNYQATFQEGEFVWHLFINTAFYI